MVSPPVTADVKIESFERRHRRLWETTFQLLTTNGTSPRIYQQTFIDTYSRVADAKLYDRKQAIVAADMLNDRIVPFYDEYEIPLLRILTDRGTEYCGNRGHHEYQLNMAVENIDHTKTRARRPQNNGICERFHDDFAGVLSSCFSKKENLQMH